MTSDERPITRTDYRRARVTLWALELKALGHDDGPLWEILRDLHEEHLQDDPPVPLGDLVGDGAAAGEVHHANLLLEALARGRVCRRGRFRRRVRSVPRLAAQT